MEQAQFCLQYHSNSCIHVSRVQSFDLVESAELHCRYAPAYERFGSQISAIHFIGPNKPWSYSGHRAPFLSGQKSAPDAQQAYDYDSLVDRWYAVYDKHYRATSVVPDNHFQPGHYESAWDNEGVQLEQPTKMLSLEELKKLAIEGLGAAGVRTPSRGVPQEGEYRSFPLPGRVDLVRRIGTPPPVVPSSATSSASRASTLLTPGPSEVPDSPHPYPVSLPSSTASSMLWTGGNNSSWDASASQVHVPWTGDIRSSQMHALWPGDNSSLQVHARQQADGISSQVHARQQVDGISSHGHAPWTGDNNPSQLRTPWTGDNSASQVQSQNAPWTGQRSSQDSFQNALWIKDGSSSQDNTHQGATASGSPTQQTFPIDQHVKDYADQSTRGTAPGYSSEQTSVSQDQGSYRAQQPLTEQRRYEEAQTEYKLAQAHYEEAQSQSSNPNISPPRPPSPPMMTWNPALEPPPSTAPPSSAFPAQTYFENVWDKARSRQHDNAHHPTQVEKSSSAFFQPPPPVQIPESLRRQGHYDNVVGSEQQRNSREAPTPDANKVQSVFPWENKRRHMPSRHFPAGETPQPELFVNPDAVTPPAPFQSPHVPSPRRSKVASPIQGFPPSLSFRNAWDAVPSIQRYASRFHPSKTSPTAQLAEPFDSEEWHRHGGKTWDRPVESSNDGDEGDDEDDESDSNPPPSSKSLSHSRRGSSVSASYVIKGKKKEYVVRGVQTISPVMVSQGVQVETVSQGSSSQEAEPSKLRKPSMSRPGVGSKRYWAPPSIDSLAPVVTGRAPPDIPTPTLGSPTVRTPTGARKGLPTSPPSGLLSPREFAYDHRDSGKSSPATITPSTPKASAQPGFRPDAPRRASSSTP